MTTAVVWFKTDLRIQDNETLIRALEQSDQVVPVYCFDDAHFQTTKFGVKKTGKFRAQFLLESLADLDAGLRALGSGLLIVRGKPEEEILKIVKSYSATKVFAKNEVAFEEQQTEKCVANALAKINCTLETVNTSTLYDVAHLPFAIKDLPDIFTHFRKEVEKNSNVRKVFAKPLCITSPNIPPMQLPSLSELGLPQINIDSRATIVFKGGESNAHKRLQHYFYETKAISSYKLTRNGMIGENYSSKFSAWLAHGCISANTIYEELNKYETIHGSNESTYWLFFELLWRDYFYFVMQKFGKKLFLKNGIKDLKASLPKFNEKYFSNWKNGATGVDFIDANMLELKCTGYMSNRGRQNVASYLCNDLKIDWRYGAAYFEEQLIDYDVCSNWGNWAYLAGVGNDPRPNRYFNIDKQAKDYDEDGAFRKWWLGKK